MLPPGAPPSYIGHSGMVRSMDPGAEFTQNDIAKMNELRQRQQNAMKIHHEEFKKPIISDHAGPWTMFDKCQPGYPQFRSPAVEHDRKNETSMLSIIHDLSSVYRKHLITPQEFTKIAADLLKLHGMAENPLLRTEFIEMSLGKFLLPFVLQGPLQPRFEEIRRYCLIIFDKLMSDNHDSSEFLQRRFVDLLHKYELADAIFYAIEYGSLPSKEAAFSILERIFKTQWTIATSVTSSAGPKLIKSLAMMLDKSRVDVNLFLKVNRLYTVIKAIGDRAPSK